MNQYTIRDKHAYLQLFAGATTEKAVGESSVFYLYYPGTAERIHAEIPDAKIVIMLRNPVDRAYSAYMHLIRDEREHLEFEQSLYLEEQRKQHDFEPLWLYRELGLYSQQVQSYMNVFPADQVKVVFFEEFSRNTRQVVRDVFAFLDVEPDFSIDTPIRYNESGVPKSRLLYNFIAKPNRLKEAAKPFVPAALRERWGNRAKSMVLGKMSMEPTIRRELSDYFAEDIARLEMTLERDLSIWK